MKDAGLKPDNVYLLKKQTDPMALCFDDKEDKPSVNKTSKQQQRNIKIQTGHAQQSTV